MSVQGVVVKLTRESAKSKLPTLPTISDVVTDCEVIWIPLPVSHTCWPWYDNTQEPPEVKVFTEDGTHIGYVLREHLK